MNKKYFWTFFVLIAIYVTLAFSLPTDPEILKRYDITQSTSRWLNLSIVAPLAIVYFAALYGFLRLRSYSESVKKTKEGPQLYLLSTGLMVLAFSLPINSIFGSVLNYIEHSHAGSAAVFTILRNYLVLLLAFVAFVYIARGAKGLVGTLKEKENPGGPVVSLLGPIALSSLFTWLVISQPQSTITEPVYYMPNIFVILTLAIPYVYIWCVAIKAANNLYFYRNRVKGRLYKRALDNVAKGIFVIVLISIFIQVITTISERLNRLDLGMLLLVVYVLVALYALGYGLVARGAKKLKQIEEV